MIDKIKKIKELRDYHHSKLRGVNSYLRQNTSIEDLSPDERAEYNTEATIHRSSYNTCIDCLRILEEL
jgi:hypothetical protein